MIIRRTPKNKDRYIIVNCEVSNKLNQQGFHPKYIDNDGIYYVKSIDIIEYMKKEDLQCKNL